MGTNEVKKSLWSYQTAKREYERLKRKIEEIETQITAISIDYSKEKVQGSKAYNDKMAEAIDKLAKLRESAEAETNAMSESMVEVYTLIDKAYDPLQKQILQMRYIEGLEWETICYNLGYSWSHTHRMHKEALIKLGGMM